MSLRGGAQGRALRAGTSSTAVAFTPPPSSPNSPGRRSPPSLPSAGGVLSSHAPARRPLRRRFLLRVARWVEELGSGVRGLGNSWASVTNPYDAAASPLADPSGVTPHRPSGPTSSPLFQY
ncbi:Os10g0432400 [Oryza sativa Japonica Group]|uniref:Expressed protein n=2 Tax=Oryza sativa subsp. japonica TaxID=39947 RepID=Q337X0_ORYSJ|nr:expressed protein [Oryza sativa Japonica Group]BAF26583.1 Os10g0432400 [Oryza sativa Japonica Group]BAT10963.1 Os10g0432400 [Oryza sativa Japonica Group]|eukprot:NP_001064669.1 Os10g0432400 [Oryza sativa Japonica Group]